MTDTVHDFAGKKLFTKLDCSQAYLCIEMTDPLSVHLLSFVFVSKAYTYTKLAQDLKKSVNGFSSFVRSYLCSCLAVNLGSQFMDDIKCGLQTFEQMIPTLRQKLDCLRKSGLRLNPHKCEFGIASTNFFGNTFTPNGLTPETAEKEKNLKTIKLPTTVGQLKKLFGFVVIFAH